MHQTHLDILTFWCKNRLHSHRAPAARQLHSHLVPYGVIIQFKWIKCVKAFWRLWTTCTTRDCYLIYPHLVLYQASFYLDVWVLGGAGSCVVHKLLAEFGREIHSLKLESLTNNNCQTDWGSPSDPMMKMLTEVGAPSSLSQTRNNVNAGILTSICLGHRGAKKLTNNSI